MEKPTFKQKLDGFCTFVYNSETGQLLGRGGRSWAEIGFFYLVYYICLSAFFAATMVVFYETMDVDKPKLQGDSSLLKGNPGLGYKPMPDIETTLVHVTIKNQEAAKKSIEDILNAYGDMSKNVNCSKIVGTRHNDTEANKKACRFDVAGLKEFCNATNFYGYGSNNPQPCVLLKLNKIFGWKPEISATKPDGLQIEGNGNYTADKIWIDCAGENNADKDNIGDISYYPQQGFPLAFYPYRKQDNYVAPLVMVKFNKPLREMGMMVMCKAYAKNIELDPSEKQGSVQFELLVDTPAN